MFPFFLFAFISLSYGDIPPNLGQCNGTNWDYCRTDFMNKALGYKFLPTQEEPDFIIPMPNYVMHGFPSSGNGTGVGNVTWANNLHQLIWTLKGPFLTLNATVWHSFNTSGAAPGNYPPPPRTPGSPNPSYPDYFSYKSRGNTLILYHNGHETDSCIPNYDGVVDYFNEFGYDVIEFEMPLIGCNAAFQYGNPKNHQWFEQWEQKGEYTIRYFVEPVFLAINYALKLGYKQIVMVGLSGGGWTTVVASAMDKRIQLSIPIAGSIPKFHTLLYPYWIPNLPEGSGQGEGGGGDYEQNVLRPMYQACGFVCMYTLASVEPLRTHIQILHEWDSCCFRGVGFHADIVQYNQFIQPKINGWMQTVITAGNYHQVNVRDKVIVAKYVELFRKRALQKQDFLDIPFDILDVQNIN